jgi:uncharacterized protein YbbC (DUF1343 family)
MMRHFSILIFTIFIQSCAAQAIEETKIIVGAEQTEKYLPLLIGKNVGLFVNHTSRIGNTHLTDSLILLGVKVKSVFTPEHGFRGNLSDGEKVDNENIEKPFELISLYGKTQKPTDEQIQSLDIVVIDIQDVGVRFYTYASTMTYLMDACAKNKVPVLILDRPNPNGSYIDGPVLKKEFSSFVGLHPIPLVHGLTLGELAKMINGEKWIENKLDCQLTVIPVKNWDHKMPYVLPVKPSPNLPNELSVALYPSLALFEGTVVSLGRGTDKPFQILGHPKYSKGSFSFTPMPNEGSKYPPLEGQICYGMDLSSQRIVQSFTLSYLIDFYQTLNSNEVNPFFNQYFTKLAGTDKLQKQIEAGLSEEAIRATWQEDLDTFKKIRKQYLIYE